VLHPDSLSKLMFDFKPVVPRHEIQAELMEFELNSARGLGVTNWLMLGIRIQELQYVERNVYIKTPADIIVHCRTVLVAFLRKQGKCPLPDQRVEIARRRAVIKSQIDTFHELAENLFPTLDVYDIHFNEIPFGDDIISDAEDDDPSTVPTIHRGDVEKMDLLLPSAWSRDLPDMLSGARDKEIQLRIAQADESLEAIRREICHKSYIYRTDVRLATNKKAKLRGYSAANAVDRALKHQVRIYKQARWALGQLHAPATTMARYKPLLDSDLKALKSIYSPNEPGQSTATIPWIWKVNRPAGLDSTYIVECKLSCSGQQPAASNLPDVLLM
jgi:hypothetical protein